MGHRASAHLAWGVDFGDYQNDEGFDFAKHDLDTSDMEERFPELFGFTEQPPELPAGWDELAFPERQAWSDANSVPYRQRKNAAVPLVFRSYGHDYGGTTLVLRRSLTSVTYGSAAIDTRTIMTPTPAEIGAFATVWREWDIDWPLAAQLLLMALYG